MGAQITLRNCLIIAFTLAVSGCGLWLPKNADEHSSSSSEGVGVSVTPVHHLGKNYSVERVFINGYSVFNIGRGGGGGSIVCCVMLPQRWRPSLVAKVKWTVLDWRNEVVEETKRGVHRSVTIDSAFEAEVPVEYYDEPNTVYIHIFGEGKARVVSSIYAPFSEHHPVKEGRYEDGGGTLGKRVKQSEDGRPWNGW